MMVRPKFGLGVVKKIYDCGGLLEVRREPISAQCVVDRLKLPYAPIFVAFKELGGEDRRNQAIKARVVKIESCVPHRLNVAHLKRSHLSLATVQWVFVIVRDSY